MKLFLLLSLFFISSGIRAQDAGVNNLPQGKYEMKVQNGSWEKGDIILLDNERYRISSNNETGEYRFSATAQRVFFTSGPLKGVFARTMLSNNAPAILIPLAENQQMGIRMAHADVLGRLRN